MIASLSRGSMLDEVLHGGFNEQQLAAYVSWVNSQLKRKPGLKPITSLRRDLQDGVVLTQLIEIVAGETLDGVHVAPQNKEESGRNVEQVLQFISSRRIHMPHISARDIVDGNLKSVMRIILALAAHFKPSANHRAGNGRSLTRGSVCHNPLSPVALAQGAAAALASARLDASQPTRATRLQSGVRALVKQYERGTPDEPDSPQPSRNKQIHVVPLSSFSYVSPVSSPRASDRPPDDPRPPEGGGESSHDGAETSLDVSFSDTLEKEVQETRHMVSTLQALLLRGSLPEDEQDASLEPDQGAAEQQLVVVRGRLDQSMEEARELKRELLRCKQEMRNLQAVKDAQQQRLCSQEASILQMKQELLRAGMAADELNNHNAELQWKLEDCNKMWGECKKEAGQKDRLLQQLQHKRENELQRELERNNISQIPISTEHNGHSYPGSPAPPMSDAEEVQLLRDSLRSLRNDFRDHAPQHHTLDTLEQGIVSLIDRLHLLHTQRGRGKSPRRRGQHTESDTWPRTEVCQPHNGPSASTKILYFIGKSPTPSMINIPKRLGEISLRDVKAAVDREGNYRYHFKALDPEFGTVKEEVFLDGAIIPGWEGKIVAWVEEDRGEERPL